jgi:hypothetical protein
MRRVGRRAACAVGEARDRLGEEPPTAHLRAALVRLLI